MCLFQKNHRVLEETLREVSFTAQDLGLLMGPVVSRGLLPCSCEGSCLSKTECVDLRWAHSLRCYFRHGFDPLPNSTHKAQLRRLSLETVAVTKEHLMKARWVSFCRAKKSNQFYVNMFRRVKRVLRYRYATNTN